MLRIKVAATIPEAAIQVLAARGLQCSTLRKPDQPWEDLYEIQKSDGVLRWASRHSDLFETIAEVYR